LGTTRKRSHQHFGEKKSAPPGKIRAMPTMFRDHRDQAKSLAWI